MSNQYLGDDRIVHESIDVSKASSRRIYSNSEAPDDIVTRLRDVGFSLSPYGDAGQNRATVFRAADEIERLRERLWVWRKLTDDMANCLDSSTEASDLLADYEQAVRGE